MSISDLIKRDRSSNIPIHHAKRWNAPSLFGRNMDSLLNDFFDYTPSVLSRRNLELPENDISVDIEETDKGYKVSAELPGMDKDHVDISISDRYLTIKGEKKEEKEEKESNYIYRERYFGSVERSLYLPENADGDKAKASFNKGVLIIEIPKKEGAATKKKIEVK
jgi:HSP20 family protein